MRKQFGKGLDAAGEKAKQAALDAKSGITQVKDLGASGLARVDAMMEKVEEKTGLDKMATKAMDAGLERVLDVGVDAGLEAAKTGISAAQKGTAIAQHGFQRTHSLVQDVASAGKQGMGVSATLRQLPGVPSSPAKSPTKKL